jgi:hypothetical protein
MGLPCRPVLGCGQQGVFLGLEVEVVGALAATGGAGDVVDGSTRVAAFCEDPAGGIEEVLAGEPGPELLWRAALVHVVSIGRGARHP